MTQLLHYDSSESYGSVVRRTFHACLAASIRHCLAVVIWRRYKTDGGTPLRLAVVVLAGLRLAAVAHLTAAVFVINRFAN